MNEKLILILSCVLIIIGAILKITHTWDDGNNWIFIGGYVGGFVYFLLRARKKQPNS